ncbi:MAG: sulfatase [Sphingomonadaceae bacterium]|nr:sulfatase [Sphingomonadaceae bacterium]
MWKKILLGLLVVIVIGGGLAWFNRQVIILYVVANRGKAEVAAHRPIQWETGPEEAAQSPNERPPNIVFILADDLGINDISTFGGGRIPTPNIDRLAAEGMIFSQAYSGTASCAPSRAMLMTGRYPTRTGFEFTPTPDGMGRIVNMFFDPERSGLPPLIQNDIETMPSFEEQGLPGSEVTIAEVLGAADYHTVHIGKWHLGRGAEFGANAQGFNESLLMASGLFLPEDDPDVVNARLDFDPIDQFLWGRMQYAAQFNDGDWFEPGGYLTDWWTDEAVNVIRANRNRPFFLYLAHWGVHTPLQATRADYDAVGDIEPHRERVYAAMIRSLDRSVGRIMDELEAQGLAENTIIVFSSDNGGAGYIGIPDVNAPYRGWKLTFFEGGIRVPMFIRWPARIAAGSANDTPVAHIDLMPTLASAAGADLPGNVPIDGVDLLPAARGDAISRPNDAIFWQSGYYRVVRQGDWKLQVSDRPDRSWLYNLATDPTEQRNLATHMPRRTAAMRRLLDRHRESGRAPLYPHTLEAPIAVDRSLASRVEAGDEVMYWPN